MNNFGFWIVSVVIFLPTVFALGIFDNLFPRIIKQADAESQKFSREKKLSLIRELVKKRLQNDQLLKNKYEGKMFPK